VRERLCPPPPAEKGVSSNNITLSNGGYAWLFRFHGAGQTQAFYCLVLSCFIYLHLYLHLYTHTYTHSYVKQTTTSLCWPLLAWDAYARVNSGPVLSI
jgi:hypothetical protein